MRYKAVVLSALVLAWGAAQSQDSGAPPTWSLEARINGVELVGDWELGRIRGIEGDAAADQAADSSEVSVAKNSSFQISVDLLNPTGTRQDVTGSSNLIYRPQGCLSITSAGVATVATASSPRWTCNAGDVIPLTIVYKDEANGVAAMNMYLLKIE